VRERSVPTGKRVAPTKSMLVCRLATQSFQRCTGISCHACAAYFAWPEEGHGCERCLASCLLACARCGRSCPIAFAGRCALNGQELYTWGAFDVKFIAPVECPAAPSVFVQRGKWENMCWCLCALHIYVWCVSLLQTNGQLMLGNVLAGAPC
jgi:hypothetical protein